MDTSETYIKMCEKAEEIQSAWEPQGDNRYFSPRSGIVTDRTADFPVVEGKAVTKPNVWLPRQDQLQEMMGLSDRQLMKQFRNFLIWITGVKGWDRYNEGSVPDTTMPYGLFLPSFEQLWLAFVMKEKYNKVWNRKDWIDV